MRLPKIFAHRGGRKWAPENTLAAFAKSLELGVDGIELDVQRCASGELVVIHDHQLSRTTTGAGLVQDATFAELSHLSAGLSFGEAFKEERIPLLSQVLDLIAGKMIINIELKNAPVEYPGLEDDLLDVIKGYPTPEGLLFSSFDHHILQQLHRKAPSLNIAVLAACSFVDIDSYAAKLGAGYLNAAFDCLTAGAVSEAQAVGLEVNVWTVNTASDWSRAITLGVDGIITDDPEGLKAYLAQLVLTNKQGLG